MVEKLFWLKLLCSVKVFATSKHLESLEPTYRLRTQHHTGFGQFETLRLPLFRSPPCPFSENEQIVLPTPCGRNLRSTHDNKSFL